MIRIGCVACAADDRVKLHTPYHRLPNDGAIEAEGSYPMYKSKVRLSLSFHCPHTVFHRPSPRSCCRLIWSTTSAGTSVRHHPPAGSHRPDATAPPTPLTARTLLLLLTAAAHSSLSSTSPATVPASHQPCSSRHHRSVVDRRS